jgi:RNA polymerase sigma-70 factor (ECF subfamily)
MGTEVDIDFDRLYAAAFRRLTVAVYAMTGSLTEAEDAVQEAFARAWQRWPTVSACDDPEAWVRTVAVRFTVSTWRKAVSRRVAHRRHGAASPVPALSPDHLVLMDALRRINADQRRVIVLHYLVGLPIDRIAADYGMSVNTVKTRLYRGRKALAPHVSEFVDDLAVALVPGSKEATSDV